MRSRIRFDGCGTLRRGALTGAILSFAVFSAGGAVEVEQGRIYAGGTRLEAAELGTAFTVPKGWRGTWPAGTEVFVLQPESDPNVTILAMGEEGSKTELAGVMSAPIDLGGGVILHPTGGVGQRGEVLTGRYQVRGGAGALSAYGEALAGAHGLAHRDADLAAIGLE